MSSQEFNSDARSDSAAPHVRSVRQASAVHDLVSRRLRRRGPRSSAACLRRSVPKHSRSLPGMCLGEARHLVPVSLSVSPPPHPSENISSLKSGISSLQPEIFSESKSKINLTACRPTLTKCKNGISIYLINIQCLLARIPELVAQLELHQPHVVCVQETWLDASSKK